MCANHASKEYLLKIRHSTEHVLQAVLQTLYPELNKAIGPATDDGFYFDFDLENKSISSDDFEKIENEMQKIIDKDLNLTIERISYEEAKKLFSKNPYKLELIEEHNANKEKLTIVKLGDIDIDLCAGPHVKSTKEIKAFKLLKVAGAYWRGSEKNKMLQRIYGTAFENKEHLNEYLEKLEIAAQRDHRKVGKELDLFAFSDLVGKGLPLFTEKGTAIWRELQRFIEDEEIKSGYKHVRTPNIAKTDLYKKSGHYPYYKDSMYPAMHIDEDELILRPMTCPHHFALYMNRPRSYKELPLRYAELANLYRYEKSGELTGLIRLRGFCLADSHNFVRIDQAQNEIHLVLDLIERTTSVLGFIKGEDYIYRLSLGNIENKDKYYDSPKEWKNAENILRSVLKDREAPYYEAKDEAAFYGPKIDIQMKNVLGKEDTAFTVQYDFVLPKRFELKYINEHGKEEEPVVIHRSSIGCLERTLAFMLEKTGGTLPVWLSPTQVQIIPIVEKHNQFALEIEKSLIQEGLRAIADTRNETMQSKIRDAQIEKIPYMLIIGDKELGSNQVSVRLRNGEDKKSMPLSDFLDKIKGIYLTKSPNLW